MKISIHKIIIAAAALLLLTTGCKKAATPAASWAFEGNTYTSASCTASVGGILTSTNINSNNLNSYGTIQCQFYNALPTSGNTFTVVPYPPANANQLSILLTTAGGSITYGSTGGGHNKATVTVNNGFVTVAGNGILMGNTFGGTDTSALSLSLTQTQ